MLLKTMFLRTLLVSSFLLASPPALARVLDPVSVLANNQNSDLHDGFARYDELEFEAGLDAFESALTDPKLSPTARAAAALYGGLIAHSLGNADKAKTLFEQALEAIPDLELPTDAPPKTQLAFGEAKRKRRELAPEKADTMKVELDWAETPAKATEETPLSRQWWLWAGVGAVVVGGTVAALVIANGGDTPPTCGSGNQGCVDVTLPALYWSSP